MTQRTTDKTEALQKKHSDSSSPISLLNDTYPEGTFKGNIENFIGLCMVPIGLAGPLSINGQNAKGEFDIPMATTEGALVASYSRGLKAGRSSGGFMTKTIEEATQRCPLFKFINVTEAVDFVSWIVKNDKALKLISEEGSRYARLEQIKPSIEGNEVILDLSFSTGDASGQNMVTICSQKVCEFIEAQSPIAIQKWYIESNAAGDKKVGSQSLMRTRGKKVIAEVTISASNVESILKSTPARMVSYWQSSCLAQMKTGSIGNQGHVANGLTAMFLATGQDVACITEAAQAINRMEITSSGDLYASLTLPNVIVGTVGGGTGLPTQKQCLEMIDCFGVGKARKLAEIITAVALAGELSIAAAIVEGHFTQAHSNLGRA